MSLERYDHVHSAVNPTDKPPSEPRQPAASGRFHRHQCRFHWTKGRCSTRHQASPAFAVKIGRSCCWHLGHNKATGIEVLFAGMLCSMAINNLSPAGHRSKACSRSSLVPSCGDSATEMTTAHEDAPYGESGILSCEHI